MKHLFVTSILALVLLAACQTKQDDEQIARLQHSRDSLQAIVDTRDAEINTLFETLNQIEDNLAIISSKYGAVKEMKRNDPEGNMSITSDIASQLNTLDQMLEADKKKIAYLNEKIKAFGNEKGSLQEFVTKLETRIAEQEEQISALTAEIANNRAQISQLNDNVATLTSQNEEKDRTIAKQTAEANRAYYVCGTYEELQSAGIVAKEGGFIGIGRKQMVVPNLPVEHFTQLDITQATAINVNMRNAVVISSHPAGSYQMVYAPNDKKLVAKIEILDPVLFWQNTRYLIVSTK